MEERSAGAVVFRIAEGGRREYLLLKYPSGYWEFPKGNVEPGETPRQAAAREVEEETGLRDLEFLDGFEERITYFYRREGQVVRKEVIFYLARALGGEVRISWEHVGYIWTPYEEALKAIPFENSRRVLERAEEFLRERERQRTLDAFY